MTTERTAHTATLLDNGTVLVTGGLNDSGAHNSCEIYNPYTEKWITTMPMSYCRVGHSAILLQDGNVLVAGGSEIPGGNYLVSCELYDPETAAWYSTDSLREPLGSITSILLKDGKVMAVGEADSLNCQIYDPTTGKWSVVESPTNPIKYGYTASLLTDGRVLLVGFIIQGREGPYYGYSSEIFDPYTHEWSFAQDMNIGRAYHTASLLSDGQLLVLGGEYVSSLVLFPVYDYYNQCEVYDPAQDKWFTTDSLRQPRKSHSSTLLSNGDVLVVGGRCGSDPHSGYHALNCCELYKEGHFIEVDSIAMPRYGHTATILDDGRILVSGGTGGTDSNRIYLNSCESYSPEITGINKGIEKRPHRIELAANYPNPFNPATTIAYSLYRAAYVKLAVFDVYGREIATLVNRFEQAGNKSIQYNARELSSGVYFYRLQAGNYTQTRKMLLLK